MIRENTHDQTVVNEIWKENIYPLENISFNPEDIVIDIGGHAGLFALYASQFCQTIYSFEALPDNFKLFQKNIALNHVESKIKVYPYAVFRPGQRQIKLYQTYLNSGGHTAMAKIGRAVSVEALRLEEEFSRV